MAEPRITLKCSKEFKDAFVDHCGLVNMSVKIRNLIEIDMAKSGTVVKE